MGESVILRAFAAGELAPGLYARADLAKYVTGARRLLNFVVRRHGGAANRPGTAYVATAKAGAGGGRVFLRPFEFASADRSFAVEIGDGYFRFHRNGAPVTVSGVAAYSGATPYVQGDLVTDGGVTYYAIAATTGNAPPNGSFWWALTGTIYEIPTPYASANWLAPNKAVWSQQGLVVTITHLDHPTRLLTYEGLTRWTLTDLVTGPSIGAPTALSATAGTVGTKTFRYVVTAAAEDSYEESNPSALFDLTLADDPTEAAPHVLTWTIPAAPASEYYIYSDGGFGNNTLGFIGVATGQNTFNDSGEVPDFSATPPIPRVLFASTFNYPAANTVYQQRRFLAGTHNNREETFASQTGFGRNFAIRVPLQDDDAVTFTLASARIQTIKHLVPLKQLVMLTDTAEWIVRGDESGVITPTAINLEPHSYRGSDSTQPLVLGNSILHVHARSSMLLDLRFDEQVDGLGGRDLTLYASHLFRGYTIEAMGLQQIPDSIVWVVRNDGRLLGLTYIREEDVWGWHQHATVNGAFEDVCVIPESTEDAAYFVVQRTFGSTVVRYIERLTKRDFLDLDDACFVDCAAVQTNGTPSAIVSGLAHLNGIPVTVYADGARVPGTFTPAAGTITLPSAVTRVAAGLAMTCELETLDLDVAGSAVRDSKKRVGRVSVILEASHRGFKVGPDAARLTTFTAEAWQVNDEPFTGTVEQALNSSYGDHGRVFIRHTEPTPLTILGLMPHVEVGG